jgi:hypothetical protein
VSVKIYVEGGGHSEYTRAKCREGFARYCEKVVPPNRKPKIVACGGRQQTFDRFKTEVGRGKTGERCALLVDSEGPVKPDATPTAHLSEHDRWSFQGLPSQHVFLMVQAMEAWFLADRAALAAYYEDGFRPNALRGDERHVEAIAKADLESSLANSSRDTQTKGTYHKTRHAFDLLARIDPNKVESGSAHAAVFHAFLRST